MFQKMQTPTQPQIQPNITKPTCGGANKSKRPLDMFYFTDEPPHLYSKPLTEMKRRFPCVCVGGGGGGTPTNGAAVCRQNCKHARNRKTRDRYVRRKARSPFLSTQLTSFFKSFFGD